MSRYDFQNRVPYIKFDDLNSLNRAIQNRIRSKPQHMARFRTGIKDFRKVFGDLPKGLTLFSGGSGTGKSNMAKFIAKSVAEQGFKVIYAYSESGTDRVFNENIINMDYTSWLPNWQKAINQVFFAVSQLDADLLVIDSITNFLSSTRKAVSEAEIRGGIFDISKICQYQIPVIATSQIRGSGNFSQCAGGRGVDHAPDLFLWFDKVRITTKFLADDYDARVGEIVWIIHAEKDRQGLSDQGSMYKVVYENDNKELKFYDLQELRIARYKAKIEQEQKNELKFTDSKATKH
ncbi:MAG: RAD55 family ATPase [Candidatus Odinarchaeia archaeon]